MDIIEANTTLSLMKWLRLASNYNPSLPAMPLVSSFSTLTVEIKQTNDLGQRGIKCHDDGIVRQTSLVIVLCFIWRKLNMWHLAGRVFFTAADVEVSMELFSFLCTLH